MTSHPGTKEQSRRWGVAWLMLTGALGLHVVDEAVNDFLSYYNPAVESTRVRLPWLPLPTLEFPTWLGLLVFALVTLLLLSVPVFQGKWGMKPVSHVYAWLMITNALFHVAVALRHREPIGGVLSSPLLLAGSVLLLQSIPGRVPRAVENRRLPLVPGERDHE